MQAFIERVLELPQGTLARWEREGPPPEGRALLGLLARDPFLLDKYEIRMDRLRRWPPLTTWRPLTRVLPGRS